MNTDITLLPAWKALGKEAEALRQTSVRQLFAGDADRVAAMHLRCGDLLADFSKQRISRRALALLRELADARQVEARIAGLFAGDTVNPTERRPALHMALRANPGDCYQENGRDVVVDVLAERSKLRDCCASIHSGAWRGISGEAITDVVNLGIGGSDLGPRMAEQALAASLKPGLRVHFVSNIDGADLASLLRRLSPQRTLFIVASKTFTTQETLSNARSAVAWLLAANPASQRQSVLAKHCLAVSANVAAAAEFGIAADNIFAFWDWVGGRYSLWSSVGLGLALAVGMDNFEAMLAGAREMDVHFRQAPLAANLPATLALLEVWNSNFLGAETHAIVPYSRSLHLLPAYLQQLVMESNGKSVDNDGRTLRCQSSPIVWGSAGSDAQHSYFQLLHQGGRLVPIDFIAFAQADFPLGEHHQMLLANCLAQSEALMRGCSEAEARQALEDAGMKADEVARLLPHKIFAGSQPTTTLLLPRLSPRTLGMLIALYEHQVFVTAAIWGINPFDQFGVELGKQMANALLPALRDGELPAGCSDSTRFLLDYCRSDHGRSS